MEYKPADRIKVTASLVVLVIDDFTDRVINDGSIRVTISDAPKPIRKSEGYYVFVNLTQKTALLTVTGNCYITETRRIDLTAVSKTEPVIKLRLKPGKNYPLLKDATSLTGRSEPFSEIRVICNNYPRYFRLLYDYDSQKNTDEIAVFNPDKIDLDGKLLYIKNEESELLTILGTRDRENNLYQMERPLKYSYKKAGTKIYPVFTAKADENGEYFIPLWNIDGESKECRCEMLGNNYLNKNLVLRIGKMNQLDFV